jgi:pimeloyl-ACP methyl ester carboxylesterase
MSLKPHILFLHGFGSGPGSQKGVLIRDHFSARGYTVALPSISVPSLEELSPKAAVRFVMDELRRLGDREVVLGGSSFGAFVALHAYAGLSRAERAHVTSLVLLAPLFDPWDAQGGLLTPERDAAWKKHGAMPVMDLERGVEVGVHYRFVEELRSFESSSVCVDVPTLVIHGRYDEVVPVSQSEAFAARLSGVRLELCDDGHQLLKDPEDLVRRIEGFLLLLNA